MLTLTLTRNLNPNTLTLNTNDARHSDRQRSLNTGNVQRILIRNEYYIYDGNYVVVHIDWLADFVWGSLSAAMAQWIT